MLVSLYLHRDVTGISVKKHRTEVSLIKGRIGTLQDHFSFTHTNSNVTKGIFFSLLGKIN